MKKLLQIAFVIALAYVMAYYTTDNETKGDIFDFDFDFDFSELFDESYDYYDAESAVNNGMYYFDSGEYYIAIENFDAALEIDSTYTEAVYLIGQSYEKLQDFLKAEAYYKSALKDSAYTNKAYIGLANINILKNQPDTALNYVNKIIEKSPEFYSAYISRSDIHLLKNDTASAIKDLEYSTKISSEFDNNFKLGILYLKKKLYNDAERAFTITMQFEDKNLYTSYFNRALCYHYTKQYQKAANDYRVALTINNDDPNLYYNLALCYDYMNDTAKAVRNFELYSISTSDYNQYYDYAMKRIKELNGEVVESDSLTQETTY